MMNNKSHTVYVLLLSADYEGDTLFGIYDTPELAEEARQDVLNQNKAIALGNDSLWVKEVQMNQPPSWDTEPA